MPRKDEPKKATGFHKITAWVLTLSGSVGFIAALMLAVEQIEHLKHPGEALACDINPLIGCGSILDTWQGHVFGIPNELIGIAAGSVLITLGVLLLAGVKFPRWIWRGLQVGVLAGVAFVLWFLYESLFVLNHLCPYCMATWGAIIPIAWYVSVYNITEGNLLPAFDRCKAFVTKHHLDIIITIFVVIVASILLRFREFFFGA